MSENFFEKSRSIPSHAEHTSSIVDAEDSTQLHPHIQHSAIDPVTNALKTFNYKANQQLVIPKNEITKFFNTNTSIANLLQGGTLDIRVPPGTTNYVSRYTLEITMLMTSNTRLIPLHLMLDHVQIFENNGSTLIQRFSGETIWLYSSSYTPAQWRITAPQWNTTDKWEINPDTLLNGTSHNFHVDLLPSWQQQGAPFVAGVKADTLFRIFFKPNAQTVISGTVPTITNLRLILDSQEIPQKVRMDSVLRHFSGIHDWRFMEETQQTFTETWNASQEVEVVLNGVSGMMSHVWITLRDSGFGPADIIKYHSWNEFALLSASGQNMIGGNALTSEYSKAEFIKYFPGDFRNHNEILFYSHAVDPQENLISGSMTGFFGYTSNERLRIRSNSAGVRQTQQILLAPAVGGAYTGNHWFIVKGQVSDILDETATLAQQQAVINALLEKDDQVVVTLTGGTLGAGTQDLLLTYDRAGIKNVVFMANNMADAASGRQVNSSSTVTLAGVAGHDLTGSVQIDIHYIGYSRVRNDRGRYTAHKS